MKKWVVAIVCVSVMAIAAGCDVAPGQESGLSTSEQAVTEYWAPKYISLAAGMPIRWLQNTTVVFPENKTVRYETNETVTLPEGISVYLPFAGAFAFADGSIDHYPDGTTLTMRTAEANAVAVSQPQDGVSSDSGCINDNDNCIYWESIGECQRNHDYMHTHCCKSCYHMYDPNDPNDPYNPSNPYGHAYDGGASAASSIPGWPWPQNP